MSGLSFGLGSNLEVTMSFQWEVPGHELRLSLEATAFQMPSRQSPGIEFSAAIENQHQTTGSNKVMWALNPGSLGCC